jgi:hypothetical protein
LRALLDVYSAMIPIKTDTYIYCENSRVHAGFLTGRYKGRFFDKTCRIVKMQIFYIQNDNLAEKFCSKKVNITLEIKI